MGSSGSAVLAEVGLRSLFYPLGSNIVVRTACCSVGIVLPVLNTFRAIQRKDPNEQQKCLLHWAAYGSFSLAELYGDRLLLRFPLYYHIKFAFLVWLQLPPIDDARRLYVNYLHSFFLRQQARIQSGVNSAVDELVNFLCAHISQIQSVRRLFLKTLPIATKIITDIIYVMLLDFMRIELGKRMFRTAKHNNSSHENHEQTLSSLPSQTPAQSLPQSQPPVQLQSMPSLPSHTPVQSLPPLQSQSLPSQTPVQSQPPMQPQSLSSQIPLQLLPQSQPPAQTQSLSSQSQINEPNQSHNNPNISPSEMLQSLSESLLQSLSQSLLPQKYRSDEIPKDQNKSEALQQKNKPNRTLPHFPNDFLF